MKNLNLGFTSSIIGILVISLIGISKVKTTQSIDSAFPIGSIIVWPGPNSSIPKGWLLCNGDKIAKSRYPELSNIILDYWGPISGLNNDIHTLPNLQGVFLRGVNSKRDDIYSDPDRNNREQAGTGGSNEVGSFQKDMIREHRHEYLKPLGPDLKAECGNCAGVMHGKFDYIASASYGGKETRPVNAYVNYIIKAE